MTTEGRQSMADAAAEAAGLGLSVIGVRRGKAPAETSWREAMESRRSPYEIRRMLADCDADGYGIVGGPVSGHVVAIDIESERARVEILESAAAFDRVDLWDRCLSGCTIRTPGGGIHVLVRVPGERIPSRRLATDPELDGKRVLVELKGDGGYIVGPGTSGYIHPDYPDIPHPSGWTLDCGSLATMAALTPDEWEDVVGLLSAIDCAPLAPEPDPIPIGAAIAPGATRPGDDYTQRATLRDVVDLLQRHGWTYVHQDERNLHVRRPGKSSGSASATVRREAPHLLHVFSTSIPDLEAGRAYSPYQLLARLDHGGDYSAASRALAAAGYGSHGDEIPLPPGFGDLPESEGESPRIASATRDFDPSIIDEEIARGQIGGFVPLPFAELEGLLGGGGLASGVHLLVGGTGAGKTALVSRLMIHALERDHVTAMAPLEIGYRGAVVRLACDAAGVPWSAVRRGNATPDQLAAVRAGAARVARNPPMIAPLSVHGWSSADLERMCEAARERQDTIDADLVPLVVVDFAQIMGDVPGSRADARERIARASYAAQAASQRYECAILLVSSVARSAYTLVGGSPRALRDHGVELGAAPAFDGLPISTELVGESSLVGLGKESGEIEFSATTVIVLIKAGPTGRAVVVAKHRDGPPGWVGAIFDRGLYRSASPQETADIAAHLSASAAESAPDAATQILQALSEEPGMTTTELRDAVSARTAAIGEALSALEELGAIERRREGRSVRHYMIRDIAAAGLPPTPEDHVLAAIAASPGLTSSELREAASCRVAEVAPAVTALEESGAIVRRRDGRTVRHYLPRDAP